MARSRVLQASWYDYPQYYDIVFQAYTQREADFIEAACRKYCPFAARRLLEPACGTGRLITELATRGYELIGFDISQPGLRYLRRRLDSVPSLELCDVYDFRYNIAQPFAPNNEMAYSVFVLRRRRHLS